MSLPPALEDLVDGLRVVELGLGHRHLVDARAVDLVADADRDLVPGAEDVELGEEELVRPLTLAA